MPAAQAYLPRYEAVVIGTSAGGLAALGMLLSALPADYPLPIIVVQHVRESSDSRLARLLGDKTSITVLEALDKLPIKPNTVYIAPPGYHLLVEHDRTLSLSIGTKVNYARPSVDVLFESATDVYRQRLVGIVLTGANTDGVKGLKAIGKAGGLTLVQDPATAEVADMPRAAINEFKVDHIVPLQKLGHFLVRLTPVTKATCPSHEPES